MFKSNYFFTSVLVILLLFACKPDYKKIDVSKVDVQIKIDRFDQQFFASDTNNLYPSLNSLRQKDTTFFDFYTNQVMRFGQISDSISPTMIDINRFLSNKAVLELYDTVQIVYGDITQVENELSEAFKHFKYYFPNKPIPNIKSIISEFGYNAVTLDTSYIAIALDMYLGKDYKYYRSFDFPYYLIDRFEQVYIVPNAMEVLYNAYFNKSALAETEPLIYNMIENGKRLYFMECMQPQKDKNMLIGYTKEQLDWVEKSEGEIWKFYNEHDLFYTKNYMEQRRHIGEAPTTAGMPEQAPGNVGSWVGWQIVQQYMKNTYDGKKIALQQLINTPAETILNKSRYKPK
ncbi:MAG: hypothetical protein KDE33_20470 [Bacteroidetes bacterium]|nr:hypothetical protein [Bacteroidota bacterium]MCB9225617.1 hypothetical protein [Chitinophagales bacterium]